MPALTTDEAFAVEMRRHVDADVARLLVERPFVVEFVQAVAPFRAVGPPVTTILGILIVQLQYSRLFRSPLSGLHNHNFHENQDFVLTNPTC